MCCALEVITYAGLPRFSAWAMIDAHTCCEEQLSIKAWPMPMRPTLGPRSEVCEVCQGEAAANHCVLTFIFYSQESEYGSSASAAQLSRRKEGKERRQASHAGHVTLFAL